MQKFAESEMIGSYKVIGFINSGAFASVYKVIHTHSEEEYALKTQKSNVGSVISNELKIPKLVKRSKYVLGIYDNFEWKNLTVFVMPLMGDTLYQQVCKLKQPISISNCQKMGWEVLDGLMFLHRKDIVHQDLHSNNVLISQQFKHCRIADLGLARHGNDSPFQISCKNVVHYSHAVMKGQKYGIFDDLTSLGYLLLMARDHKQLYYDYFVKNMLEKKKILESAIGLMDTLKGDEFIIYAYFKELKNQRKEGTPDYEELKNVLNRSQYGTYKHLEAFETFMKNGSLVLASD